MKTGKERKPGGNIHLQQLFYWMGRSIDDRNGSRKFLKDDLVQEVIRQVQGSLEQGLWVKRPRYLETFTLGHSSFTLDLPIACFTEWSLGQSLPHTAEYGRIGLGFPKRWVIMHGGQSVTYFRHSQKGMFLQSAFRLLRKLASPGEQGRWIPTPGASGFEAIRYLLHFAKMIRVKRTRPERRPSLRQAVEGKVPTRKRKRGGATLEAQMFKRKFGMPLEFVEEREWRIVYHPGAQGFAKGPGVPDFYLPYVPGDELFTLVLPDNKVVSKVLENTWLTTRLFTPWKCYPQLQGRRVPPVTVIAHSDIGTF